MSRFHINKKGVPVECLSESCNLDSHFDSKEEAQEYEDKIQMEEYGLLTELKSEFMAPTPIDYFKEHPGVMDYKLELTGEEFKFLKSKDVSFKYSNKIVTGLVLDAYVRDGVREILVDTSEGVITVDLDRIFKSNLLVSRDSYFSETYKGILFGAEIPPPRMRKQIKEMDSHLGKYIRMETVDGQILFSNLLDYDIESKSLVLESHDLECYELKFYEVNEIENIAVEREYFLAIWFLDTQIQENLRVGEIPVPSIYSNYNPVDVLKSAFSLEINGEEYIFSHSWEKETLEGIDFYREGEDFQWTQDSESSFYLDLDRSKSIDLLFKEELEKVKTVVSMVNRLNWNKFGVEKYNVCKDIMELYFDRKT